jgi:molybdate transport system regulatory protein
MASPPAPALSLRATFATGFRFGPGKVALLEAIQTTGSIAGAAREMGMAYRRAWLLVDDMNRGFIEPVVETFPGRSSGTGAALTPFGNAMVAAYRAAESKAARAARAELSRIGANLDRSYAARKR